MQSCKLIHTEKVGCRKSDDDATGCVSNKDFIDCESLCSRLNSLGRNLGFDLQLAWPQDLAVPPECSLNVFGVHWTPEEFFAECISILRPFAPVHALPEVLMQCLEYNCNASHAQLAKLRCDYIAKWTKRAVELRSQETALKKSLDPVVANAVKDKRVVCSRKRFRMRPTLI